MVLMVQMGQLSQLVQMVRHQSQKQLRQLSQLVQMMRHQSQKLMRMVNKRRQPSQPVGSVAATLLRNLWKLVNLVLSLHRGVVVS